jgi:hypothetical protein
MKVFAPLYLLVILALTVFGLLVLLKPIRAQTDQYWQQLYSSSQGQCGASLVSLAKQLDDAKKQIEELKKQLEAKH